MAESLPVALGRRVRALRKSGALTQEALAERAGLHVTYIAGIEAGKRNPSLLSLAALAHGLDKDLVDLFHELAVVIE